MVDIIAIIIIMLMIAGAITYIYKEKKKGSHCIGCPMAGSCAKARACGELNKDEKNKKELKEMA